MPAKAVTSHWPIIPSNSGLKPNGITKPSYAAPAVRLSPSPRIFLPATVALIATPPSIQPAAAITISISRRAAIAEHIPSVPARSVGGGRSRNRWPGAPGSGFWNLGLGFDFDFDFDFRNRDSREVFRPLDRSKCNWDSNLVNLTHLL